MTKLGVGRYDQQSICVDLIPGNESKEFGFTFNWNALKQLGCPGDLLLGSLYLFRSRDTLGYLIRC